MKVQDSFAGIQFKELITIEYMIVLLLFLLAVFLLYVFIKSSYSFRLWYRFSNRFATLDDIKEMGLLDGKFMALGLFGDKVLKLKQSASVLCLGETGCGKTAGVAIPSILESDTACIIAVDNRNELAKYTSGYRASLGKVFYFNWNLVDAPLKNEFYPRWNPLSFSEMPPKGEGREKYVANLVRYFIADKNENISASDGYWEKLASTAMSGILNFFISKIERAGANDYFLSEMLDTGHLNKEDKDLLLSYYVLMDENYAQSAIANVDNNNLDMENYLPVGSWEGIPKAWQGKEINFAMFSDWLLQSYFLAKSANNTADADIWKGIVERCIGEAKFFGYNEKALETLQQVFYLSSKQRSIIFSMLVNSLSIFRHSSVRERTSSSDFCIRQSRGIKNPETGKWEVVTVYSVSGNKSVDFINRLFIDMLIKDNIDKQQDVGPFPLLFVLDDMEQQPRYEYVTEGLIYGPHSKMSFLLLSDYVNMMQDKYTTEGMEDIVSNATYKLMISDSYKTLAWKFENLAVYGTKSVQIPAVKDIGGYLKSQSGLTDANYYKIIAKQFESIKKRDLELGDEFLIAAGYYHLPIRLKCMYFLHNNVLKEKATIDACYFLDKSLEEKRNVQDMETPLLVEVLQDSGLNMQTEEDINIYLEDKYEKAVETRQDVADKQSALADDISNRWKNKEPVDSLAGDDDWWLEEDAFVLDESKEENISNPFK